MHYIVIFFLLLSNLANSRQITDSPPELFHVLESETRESDLENSYSNFGDALLDVRRIIFNQESFNFIEGDDELYYQFEANNLTGQRISFNAPGLEKTLYLNVLRYEKHLENDKSLKYITTYSGKVEGDYYSSFTFTVDDEVIIGRVKFDGLIYLIEPNDGLDGILTLSIIKESRVPKDPNDFKLSESNEKQAEIKITTKSGSGGNVRVLFKYASNVSNASVKASTLISDFNTALSNSVVSSGNFVSSAGVEMVSDTFSTLCKDDILEDMELENGVFSNLDNELISRGADIAVLLLNGPAGKSCFTGYTGTVGGEALIYRSADPFMVVADNYLTALADLTGVHEMGHIFQGYHPDTPISSMNKGIENTSNSQNKWQSIMGGYNSTECSFTGPVDSDCKRIHYFSNPALTYNGDPLGTSQRDMESWLEYVMPLASAWRGNPVPVPGTPSGMQSTDYSCYGMYEIDWNNVSGATSYKLFRSYSPSFTSPQEIYSGSSSNSFVNVTSGTWYFRAQACNVSGCSANSSQVSATRLTYCQ